MKFSFFKSLIRRSPMEKLLDHYQAIQDSVGVINDALQCYIQNGQCVEFKSLQHQLNDLESGADAIIRDIRNNLPHSILLPVNKVLLLNYTTAQDNILDSAQEALNWLSLKVIPVPEQFIKDLTLLVDEVGEAVHQLGPALKDTVALLHLEDLDRENAREQFRRIRIKKDLVFKRKHTLNKEIFNSDLEFSETYLLHHFIERMYSMSQSCGKCAEILRSMITR
ncbi:DUF47 domain-containing protein [Desulfonatronovibrio hydrogenovorans]|uniref:DUF47 domain-containing protein n=1 Tax=Desulfonatronovibrio hydrogenovorans TaxID=53245 RepID=UPI00048CF631|nr:DUF47 family protein [Desulfonatronovibrio hydrogenovorans]